MRIATSSDWREAIGFETPMILSEVLPGEPTRCFACGTDAAYLPRTQLWAFKHRHPLNHDGYVRFYCADHIPVVARPEPVASAKTPAPRARRTPATRTPATRAAASVDVVRAMCPDCFVEVSATGVCGMCGTTVA